MTPKWPKGRKMSITGGEKGIRTLGGLAPTAVFKTAAIDRSAISPLCLFNTLLIWHGCGGFQVASLHFIGVEIA